MPQSAEPHTSGPSAISRGCAAGSSSIEPEFLDDTVDVSVMGDGIPSEPAEPAILMSAAPDLNQDLPVHKQQASIVTQLERQLQKLPAAPGKFPLHFKVGSLHEFIYGDSAVCMCLESHCTVA